MPRTAIGTTFDHGCVEVTIASGGGAASVRFRETFRVPPVVHVETHDGDSGVTLGVSAITTTGFDLTVSSTMLSAGVQRWIWSAWERP